MTVKHQYIERNTGRVVDEKIYYDRLINYIYSAMRENNSILYRIITSKWISGVMAYINYEMPLGTKITGGNRFVEETGVDINEFYDSIESLDSARKFFERKIRYWECRPMNEDTAVIVSPADSRMIIGSFSQDSMLFLKEKFFSYDELLGDRSNWKATFRGGDYAVFRLTPDKYHWNHSPVSGVVEDIYEIDGAYNSCNPGAVVAVSELYSKNKRVVTVINTDVEGGTRVGRVVMIEVVALMIGGIKQCYSEERYDTPVDLKPGMFIKKGQPKSLYRPGSSVDVLIFEKGKVQFCEDLVKNSRRSDVMTRFTSHFQRPLVETDIKVRSDIGRSVIRRVK